MNAKFIWTEKPNTLIGVRMPEEKGAKARRLVYHEPIMVGVRYEEIVKEPVDQPQEAEARFQVNGKSENAFVPLYAVDEKACRAFGAIIAGSDDEVMVEFPPTTLGQSRFAAQRKDLDKIAIYRDEGNP